MVTVQIPLRGLILDPNRLSFSIPSYQREYEWGTSMDDDQQVPDLWEDLWTNCWAKKRKHFLGVIICSPGVLPNGTRCWEIVDGQQRMTTFFLLFIAMRDFLKKRGMDTAWLEPSFYGQQGGVCRLFLTEKQGSDRMVLNTLASGSWENLPNSISDHSRMLACYRYFTNKLETEFLHQDLRVPEFATVVLDSAEFLFVQLSHTDNASTIFETLNSRGRRVDDYEKIRNLILYADPDNGATTEHARNVWMAVENKLDEKQIEHFIEVLGSKNGFQSVRKTPYDEIKYDLNVATEKSRIPHWLNEILRAADIFSEVLDPSAKHRALTRILRLEVDAIYPLLVAIIELDGFESSLIGQLESLVFRLLIRYDRPSSQIRSLVEDSCQLFSRPNRAVEQIKEDLLELWKDRMPTNDSFKSQFVEKRMYGPGIQRRRLIYVLERLENAQRHGAGQIVFDQECSIEHIMPQTLSAEWKTSLREELNLTELQLAQQHGLWLNTIGNLTMLLATQQPGAGNRMFREKQPFYCNPSPTTAAAAGFRSSGGLFRNTYLNGYFDKLTRWDFRDVERRGRKLAEFACSIWKKV